MPPERSGLTTLLREWWKGSSSPNGHGPLSDAKAFAGIPATPPSGDDSPLSAKALSGVSIMPGVGFTGWQEGGSHLWVSLLDGPGSSAEKVTLATAYAAAAYAFAAMRYRAEKLSEPPLMVVKEDQKTGTEDWIPNHQLVGVLEEPAPDMDMGELLFRSVLHVDRGGQCLWVIDADGAGIPRRINLFGADEFEVESTRDELRGRFRVKTARDPMKLFTREQVLLFQEPDPNDWLRGTSRLQVYLGWLNLAQKTRHAVEQLLDNSLWPSVILQPDHQWNPKPEEFQQYKDEAAALSRVKGGALTMLGGGSATVVSSRIRDILPADILDRVEAVASTVFGVPSIVLQFLVGMANSPWSQMAEARRMCYEDTLEPLWRAWEKRLTRQLLRPIDQDRSHLIRFDTSAVRALQPDKERMAGIADKLKDIATLNERRAMVNLEPSDDPAADEIPELKPPPAPLPGIDPLTGKPIPGAAPDPEADPKRGREPVEAKVRHRDLWGALRRDQAERQETNWTLLANRQLEADRKAIGDLAREHLETKAAEDVPSEGRRRRFLEAVSAYLKSKSAAAWRKVAGDRIEADAEHVTAILTADLGFRWDLVREGLKEYASREAAWLVTQISSTTRDAVAAAVAKGVDQGLGARAIAASIEQAGAFSRDRALLIARTEATRVTNGAPVEALRGISGSRFVKTWTTAGDDRVRDEHVELDGETVALDQVFSNGLAFPSEPNCRCVLTFSEEPQ